MVKQNKIKVLLMLLLICLSGNGYSQEVTKVVVVNKPSKYVYRVLLESLNKCISTGNWLTYVGAYYDDNDTASIYNAGDARGHGDSFKLRKIDKDSTEISYFKEQCLLCSMAMAETKVEKALLWVKDGDRDCQFLNAPSNPAIIK
ncbi:hypothetical protein MCEMSEM29_01947 [Methylophilaceae bacterium]